MPSDPTCRFCAKVDGTCLDCLGCFRAHCTCDPCAHVHERAKIEECVFCRPLAFLKPHQDEELQELLDDDEVVVDEGESLGKAPSKFTDLDF